MVERKKDKEPDFFRMAMDKLKLTEEERNIVYNYGAALIHAAFDFANNPNNMGKSIPTEKIKAYADEKVPNGYAIAQIVLKKEGALKNLYYMTKSQYSLDS